MDVVSPSGTGLEGTPVLWLALTQIHSPRSRLESSGGLGERSSPAEEKIFSNYFNLVFKTYYNTTRYNTIQHNTIQYNTKQYDTKQYTE